MDKEYWNNQLATVEHYVTDMRADHTMLAFCVRDWSITEEAGMRDMAWVMCQNQHVRSEALWLFNTLKDYVNKE